ncbi:hypothetical protein GQ53DRAFT_670133 [Thozetella sp. PMI_491]|nr:hypothetical protein GQ53DRAFT_670133 [Thozetella sp. PMI_491]
MDEQQRLVYEDRSQQLRAALKKWEGDWAKAHGGDKPARNDIKQNPDIAHKYKQYNKVRDILAGKIPPPPEDEPNQRKRKSTEPNKATSSTETPSKRTKLAQTPSKAQGFAQDIPDAVTPSLSRKLFSPSAPTSIGPTPQKDGRVLGLFDLLAGTPSRSAGNSDSTASARGPQTLTTPSKRDATRPELASGGKLSRTPVSSGKRAMLDSFMTPLHKRDGNARSSPGGAKTPTLLSVSKLQFATPAFLRRTNTAPLPAVDENGEWKVEPIRLPRKPHGRSLSSVVASLRSLEEEAMDEELDVMREMEMEAAGFAAGGWPREKPPAQASISRIDAGAGVVVTDPGNPNTEIEVEDSQLRPALLGAFDDEALYDSPDEEQLGRNGQPLRVFKKKGPKRTTRKFNIRPTRSKRPPQPGNQQHDSVGTDDEAVAETQPANASLELSDPLDLGSGSEFDGSDIEGDVEDAGTAEKRAKGQARGKGKKENLIQKAVRKVSATAHANFRRLKLRNNGAKGGPGHNSRFRRRR